MKLLGLFVASFSFISPTFAAHAPKPGCGYFMNPETVTVGWTAYKTSEKVAVSGTLREIKFTSTAIPVKNLKALLSMVRAQGDLNSENKSDSGNPARDQTLFNSFFKFFAGTISGSLKHISGDDQSGKFQLKLSMNKKNKFIPMEYTRAADGAFIAKGVFDMNDFNLQKPLASLHQACEELHKGKDGISKTWPQVEIKISATVHQDWCGKKSE